jgi:long-chain acyl-CoA synthetase
MVKVSGIAVYPPQVEESLRGHEAVRDVCVVGAPDPYKMNVIRAYVVLSDGFSPSENLSSQILEWASDKLNRWSLPENIDFREELPLTRVGKVAYTELEKEAARESEAS